MKYCPIIKAECKGADCVFCEDVRTKEEVVYYCVYGVAGNYHVVCGSMQVKKEAEGE